METNELPENPGSLEAPIIESSRPYGEIERIFRGSAGQSLRAEMSLVSSSVEGKEVESLMEKNRLAHLHPQPEI